MNSDEVSQERLRRLISNALMQSDLSRAAALLEQLCSVGSILDGSLDSLRTQILTTQNTLDTIKSLMDQGERSLMTGQSGLAVVCFLEVLKLSPDHEKAWAGLQTAQRKVELRTQIQTILAEAKSYRAAGDFESARECCEMLLRIAPDHERTKYFLAEINRWIERRRQAMALMQQGDRLLAEGRVEDAIDIWEKITDVDPSFEDAAERIRSARTVKVEHDTERHDRRVIQEALRYLDRKDYSSALDVLTDISRRSSLKVDADVITRKATDGLDRHNLMKDLALRIRQCVDLKKMDEAGMLLTTLESLDATSELVKELRELLRR